MRGTRASPESTTDRTLGTVRLDSATAVDNTTRRRGPGTATPCPASPPTVCRATERRPRRPDRPEVLLSFGFRMPRVGRPVHRPRFRRARLGWRARPALRSAPVATTGNMSCPRDRSDPGPAPPAPRDSHPRAPKDVRLRQSPTWRAPADPASVRPEHPAATPTADPHRDAAHDTRRAQPHRPPPTRDRPVTVVPAIRT